MTVPICPDHADLMRALARGELDDKRSLNAETARAECAECARWWNEAFSGKAYEAVDGAVTNAMSDFAPPARHRYRWFAAVAALTLIIGGAVTFTQRREPQAPTHSGEMLSAWDFEPGTLAESFSPTGEAINRSDESHRVTVVFFDNFESGSFSGWSIDY